MTRYFRNRDTGNIFTDWDNTHQTGHTIEELTAEESTAENTRRNNLTLEQARQNALVQADNLVAELSIITFEGNSFNIARNDFFGRLTACITESSISNAGLPNVDGLWIVYSTIQLRAIRREAIRLDQQLKENRIILERDILPAIRTVGAVEKFNIRGYLLREDS